MGEFRPRRRTRERCNRRAAASAGRRFGDAVHNDERQQIDGFGQALGGVVADYKSLDPFDEKLVVRWNFVIAPYAFLSAGRHASHALNRVRIDLRSGRRLSDVVALFHALIHEVATAISLVLGEVGSKLNEMEERALDQKEIGLDVLGQARRRLVRLRRQAVPLRGLLIRMLSERPYWFDGDAVIGCQRVIARMDALIDELDSIKSAPVRCKMSSRRAKPKKPTRDWLCSQSCRLCCSRRHSSRACSA